MRTAAPEIYIFQSDGLRRAALCVVLRDSRQRSDSADADRPTFNHVEKSASFARGCPRPIWCTGTNARATGTENALHDRHLGVLSPCPRCPRSLLQGPESVCVFRRSEVAATGPDGERSKSTFCRTLPGMQTVCTFAEIERCTVGCADAWARTVRR